MCTYIRFLFHFLFEISEADLIGARISHRSLQYFGGIISIYRPTGDKLFGMFLRQKYTHISIYTHIMPIYKIASLKV